MGREGDRLFAVCHVSPLETSVGDYAANPFARRQFPKCHIGLTLFHVFMDTLSRHVKVIVHCPKLKHQNEKKSEQGNKKEVAKSAGLISFRKSVVNCQLVIDEKADTDWEGERVEFKRALADVAAFLSAFTPTETASELNFSI